MFSASMIGKAFSADIAAAYACDSWQGAECAMRVPGCSGLAPRPGWALPRPGVVP